MSVTVGSLWIEGGEHSNKATTWEVIGLIKDHSEHPAARMRVHSAEQDSYWKGRIGEVYDQPWPIANGKMSQMRLTGSTSTDIYRTTDCSNGCGRFVLVPGEQWTSLCPSCRP